jgi:hypothetical protein
MANGDLYWMMVVGISIAIAIIHCVCIGVGSWCSSAALVGFAVLCLLQLQLPDVFFTRAQMASLSGLSDVAFDVSRQNISYHKSASR